MFFHHFLVSFYPAAFYGEETESLMVGGLDVALSKEPYGAFFNGNFAVCIFILLSAFLFAGKTMRNRQNGTQDNLLTTIVQRYLRLLIPVAVVVAAFYLFSTVVTALGLTIPGTTVPMSVPKLLAHLFVYQWLMADSSIMGQLWCMYILFLGSFLAMFLAGCSEQKRKYMPLGYLLMGCFLFFLDSHFLLVMLGVLLADLHYYRRLDWVKAKMGKGIWAAGILLILLGLFCGGYPTSATPVNPVYCLIHKICFVGEPAGIMHFIGAFLLVGGIMILPKHPILESRVFRFLGEISFGVYLIHQIVVNQLSYTLFNAFGKLGLTYGGKAALTFVITVPVVILISAGFSYLIEKKINLLIKKIHL